MSWSVCFIFFFRFCCRRRRRCRRTRRLHCISVEIEYMRVCLCVLYLRYDYSTDVQFNSTFSLINHFYNYISFCTSFSFLFWSVLFFSFFSLISLTNQIDIKSIDSQSWSWVFNCYDRASASATPPSINHQIQFDNQFQTTLIN